MSTTVLPLFVPHVLTLDDGTLVRIRRVNMPDILYDVVSLVTAAAGDTPAIYSTLASGQAVPAISGFDPTTATAWPADSALAAWITNQLPTASTILAAAQVSARAAAQTARATLIAAGFSYGGKLIQTRNNVDIANINSAALRAVNDSTFTTDWITADNSLLPLDQNGLIAMQAAMVDRGNVIFAAYTVLVAQIAATADLTALNALPPLTA